MGSGKTTIGKQLAKAIGYQFVDLDHFIENRYRKTINQIFDEEGEPFFRDIEHALLLEVSSFENCVISTGGGVPCYFDNMEIMNRAGTTVYLKATVDELCNRLREGQLIRRPLLKNQDINELKNFISESLSKREMFYSQAKIIFDIKDFSVQEIIQGILTFNTLLDFHHG